jgi:lysophospholipase L1-like esterase
MSAPRLRERVLILSTLGVGGLLAGLIGEAVVRVAGLSKTMAMRKAATREAPTSGGAIARRYAALQTWTGPYGVPYQSNAEGFRDRDFMIERPAGTVRIVVLGDSVAEGLGVPVEQRFSALLEEELNRKPGAPHQVLNFARAGYSTLDEAEVLKSAVLRYTPQHVVLQVCFNDVEENERKLRSAPAIERPAGTTPPGVRAFFQTHSSLYLFLAERYNGLLLSRGIPNRLLNQVLKMNEADLQDTEMLLGRMAALCREQGIELTVAYVPLDAEVRVASEGAASQFESLIAKACKRVGVGFVPTLKRLRDATDCQAHIDDCHLSPCGHRVVAQTLAAQF